MSKIIPKVTVNMILKNEDQWVWYAIQSILPYADQILITDTGSTDETERIVKSISSPKISFSKSLCSSAKDVTSERLKQLQLTATDWLWVLDGDEIYSEETAKECISAISTDLYEGVVVRRYDLLGDIYHRQEESVGQYNLFGHTGHLVTRLLNKRKIAGLTLKGDYPLEGWYDANGNSTRERDPKNWYITKNYLHHAMYLKRSSLGGNLPMFNRSKYKIEAGITIDSPYPEVFDFSSPEFVGGAKSRRGTWYELAARFVTPIKKIKRKLV